MAGHLPFPSGKFNLKNPKTLQNSQFLAFEPIETISKSSPVDRAQLLQETLETDFESVSSISSRAENTFNLTRNFEAPEVPFEGSKGRDLRDVIDRKLDILDLSLSSSTSSTWKPSTSMIPPDLLARIHCVIYKLKDREDGFTLDTFLQQFKKTPLNLPRKVNLCEELGRTEVVELKKRRDNPNVFMKPTKEFLKWFYNLRHRMVSLPPALVSTNKTCTTSTRTQSKKADKIHIFSKSRKKTRSKFEYRNCND